MLTKFALATVSTMFATSLIAAPVSKSLNAVDEPRFDTIKEFDASIPNGVSVWELNFEEAQSGADLSIWHAEEFGCRGFDILKVRAKSPGNEGAWSELAVNVFQGVAHFKAPEAFDQVELTLSNSRLRSSNCRVLVRKANFAVPQLITMIAKVEAPTCLPNDNDVDTAETCSYSATRVDIDTREIINLMESQVQRLRLVVGGFYKLRGYAKTLDDGTSVFDIQSSERVM